jgi:hypothetical protein
MPTVMAVIRTMPVITMVVWPSKIKGKARDNRPSPPIVVIGRRWWRGIIPDHWSRRTTDFFDSFLYQFSILPNPFTHFLAIGIICLLRNGFNGMSAFIIIDHRFAILGCISGRLIILIYGIANQGPKNGSCSQSD